MKNKLKFLILGVLLPVLSYGQTDDMNYVQSTTYTQKTQTTEVASGKTEQITYIDGLGRPIQKILAKAGGGEVTPTNLMTYDWSAGNYSTNFYNMNGSQSENLIENGITPFGETDLLWKCGNDAASDADGGWNTNYFNIDKTKTYRYTVWVKRTGNPSGYAYHGTQYVDNLDNTYNGNPYFWAGTLPQANTWYLMVGIIHPHTYSSTTDSGEAGIYDENGTKISDGTEFKWQSNSTISRFRNYLYYATDVNVRQYFYKPLLQVKDGNEWKLSEILLNSQSKDMVTHTSYDEIGRRNKAHLPYANPTNILKFRADAESATNQFYQTHYVEDIDASPNPFSEIKYEDSPLNRTMIEASPGKDWSVASNHTVKFDYLHNIVSDSIKNYQVKMLDNDYLKPSLVFEGYYTVNSLFKTITKNENWKTTDGKNRTIEEYKDKQGRLILKRSYRDSVYHDKQYIYDQYDNLSYVLSPKGADLVMTKYSYKLFGKSLLAKSLVSSANASLASGYISLFLNASAKTFTLTANASFSSSIPLETGTLIQLNQNVPNTELGTIGNYRFVLEDGYLKMFSTTTPNTSVTSLTGVLTANLADYSINQNQIDDLCYQYKYDSRNRLIEKKIPQKGWEYIVYNKLDQPVLTQDQVLRAQNKWLFTKYDAFNRAVYTGIYTHGTTVTRQTMQGLVDNHTSMVETKSGGAIINGTTIYYTNDAFPNATNIEILTINYYDDYNFNKVNQLQSGSIYGQTISNANKTLATGTKVRVLDTNDWISTLMQYDDKGRAIYTATNNEYLQTTDKVKSKYDFVGNILETELTHTKGSNTAIVIKDVFTYDHQSRLLTQTQTINGVNPELIVNNKYDDLGQLKSKWVGHQKDNPLQMVDYKYNIRGWLTEINDVNNLNSDLFGFKINYNKIAEGTATNEALFNGNISQTIWKTATDDTKRGYAYKYDGLNRISDANFRKGNNLDTDAGHFDLHGVTYDKNGNILKLKRNAISATLIDNLDYAYNGNQLTKVDDTSTNVEGFKDGNTSGDDYAYDENGNMTSDKNKNITKISYNHLNLPKQIEFGAGGVDGKIMYIYDATGVKLEKKVAQTVNATSSLTTTVYAGNFNYVDNDLQFISHPEGYVEDTEDSSKPFIYFYQLKDHLGNIRIAFNDTDKDGKIDVRRGTTDIDGDGDLKNEIVEEHNYYPYGLKHKGYNNTVNGRMHKYKYYGKEYQDELNLEWSDFGARNYDASIGRWMNLDAFSQNYMRYSPYSYAVNNPVFFVDYQGKFVIPGASSTKYKRLTRYLKYGIQNVLNNPRVMAALRKHGQFTNEQIKNHLTFGKGPTIRVKQLGYKRGAAILGKYLQGAETIASTIHIEGYKRAKSEILDIDIDLIEAFEKASGKERDYLLFQIAATILHELTHYGEDRGIKVEGEEGELFEVDAYGMRINEMDNVQKLIDKYLSQKKKRLKNQKEKRQALNKFMSNILNVAAGRYKFIGNKLVKVEVKK